MAAALVQQGYLDTRYEKLRLEAALLEKERQLTRHEKLRLTNTKYHISSRQKHERSNSYHTVELVERATHTTRLYNGAQAPIRKMTHESLQESQGNKNARHSCIYTQRKYSEHKWCNNQQNKPYQKVQGGEQYGEKVVSVPVHYRALVLDSEGSLMAPQTKTSKPSCYRSLERIPAESDKKQTLNSAVSKLEKHEPTEVTKTTNNKLNHHKELANYYEALETNEENVAKPERNETHCPAANVQQDEESAVLNGTGRDTNTETNKEEGDRTRHRILTSKVVNDKTSRKNHLVTVEYSHITVIKTLEETRRELQQERPTQPQQIVAETPTERNKENTNHDKRKGNYHIGCNQRPDSPKIVEDGLFIKRIPQCPQTKRVSEDIKQAQTKKVRLRVLTEHATKNSKTRTIHSNPAIKEHPSTPLIGRYTPTLIPENPEDVPTQEFARLKNNGLPPATVRKSPTATTTESEAATQYESIRLQQQNRKIHEEQIKIENCHQEESKTQELSRIHETKNNKDKIRQTSALNLTACKKRFKGLTNNRWITKIKADQATVGDKVRNFSINERTSIGEYNRQDRSPVQKLINKFEKGFKPIQPEAAVRLLPTALKIEEKEKENITSATHLPHCFPKSSEIHFADLRHSIVTKARTKASNTTINSTNPPKMTSCGIERNMDTRAVGTISRNNLSAVENVNTFAEPPRTNSGSLETESAQELPLWSTVSSVTEHTTSNPSPNPNEAENRKDNTFRATQQQQAIKYKKAEATWTEPHQQNVTNPQEGTSTTVIDIAALRTEVHEPGVLLVERTSKANKKREEAFKYPLPVQKPYCNNRIPRRDNITTKCTHKQRQVTTKSTDLVLPKKRDDTHEYKHSRCPVPESLQNCKILSTQQKHRNGKTTHKQNTLKSLNQPPPSSLINLEPENKLNNHEQRQVSNDDGSGASPTGIKTPNKYIKTNDQTLLKSTVRHQKMHPPTRRIIETRTNMTNSNEQIHRHDKKTTSQTGTEMTLLMKVKHPAASNLRSQLPYDRGP
jgi:hypothetical protein